MDQTAEQTMSQASAGSLAAPAEIAVPSTPILSQRPTPASPDGGVGPAQHDGPAATNKSSFVSPPPQPSSSEMTPPPSSQNPISSSAPKYRRSRSISGSLLASPPAAVDQDQTLCLAYGASENLPTSTDIENADDDHVRRLAKELLSTAKEYRMSAAHFKLQHSLLSLTSSEAVKRAEVEQQLARREVEILQSEEYRSRRATSTGVAGPQQPAVPQLDNAVDRIQELEKANATLERRLRQAKRLIEEDKDKNKLLEKEITELKKRIRVNREHFSMILDRGSLSSSPRSEFPTPQHKPSVRRPEESPRSQMGRVGGQDPFAALLAADQVLSRDPGSVPSTPAAKSRDHRNRHGHSRGTHSLSSLPITPARRDNAGDQTRFFTPGHKSHHHTATSQEQQHPAESDRHDRDSTISASDVEEALTDEDVPASQASSLATSMLRRYPGSSQEEPSVPANIGKSSTLLQSKLFGQVKKAGVDRPSPSSKKRKSSADENQTLAAKKMKLRESFGIGVDA